MARPRIHTNNAARQRQYRARLKAKAAKVIQGDECYTPGKYIELAREVMGGIDLDPASCEFAQRTVKADRYFTREDDGLAREWKGKVWVNPPYSKGLIDKFVNKLCEEYLAGSVTEAVILVQNSTDTRWFNQLASFSSCFCLMNGRINFFRREGRGKGGRYGYVFFYLGENPDRFHEVFKHLGNIVK